LNANVRLCGELAFPDMFGWAAFRERVGIVEWVQFLATQLLRLGLVIAVTVLCGKAIGAPSFDGVYKGTQQVILSENSGSCARGDPRPATLVVRNNHFQIRWLVVLELEVMPDGTFEGSRYSAAIGAITVVRMKGKITGDNLEADIGNQYCVQHFSLTKDLRPTR